MMLHEHAQINAGRISELVKNYDGKVTFTAAGKNPVFVYHLVKNSRDAGKQNVIGALSGFVEDLGRICLEAV